MTSERVAHWNSSEFFLERTARREYTTTVITPRVMRRGCRTEDPSPSQDLRHPAPVSLRTGIHLMYE
jgi:hypothetical protein